MKSFPQFTRDYIRDGISYANLLLLQLSIPPYRGLDEKGAGKKGKKGSKGPKGTGNGLSGFRHVNELFEVF
jgi:hypothetical protein